MMNYLFSDYNYDKRSRFSSSEQLYYHVINKIISYQVIPNQPFPTVVELAGMIHLTPAEIQVVYDRLVLEKYCRPLDASIGVVLSAFSEQLTLGTMMDVEQILSFHGLSQQLRVITDYSSGLSKSFQEWMLTPKQAKRRELHRLHLGNQIPFFYSVVSMDPAHLSLHCATCNSVDELLEDWGQEGQLEWTTMVLFSLSLPEVLANHFGVLEGSSAFALRASLLNNNGMMLATFMYVFTPRIFFNTKLSLNDSH